MNRLAMMVLKNIHKFPGVYAKLCRYARCPENYPELERYRHIRHILELAVQKGNVTVQVFGQENLPAENGYLLCGNHQGMFDVVALVVSHPGPLAAVFKKELENVPLLKQIIACTKSFAMDRENARQSLTVIQAVSGELRAGRNYVIFPEGTRSRTGNQMRPFHPGSFRCAVKAKCPVVPMVFVDCYKVLDQKGSKPLSVELHYLEPIRYEEYRDMKTTELAAMVQERIRRVLEERGA